MGNCLRVKRQRPPPLVSPFISVCKIIPIVPILLRINLSKNLKK